MTLTITEVEKSVSIVDEPMSTNISVIAESVANKISAVENSMANIREQIKVKLNSAWTVSYTHLDVYKRQYIGILVEGTEIKWTL